MWWEHLDFASSKINALLLSSVPLLQQNAEKCVFHTQQAKHAQENYNHANTSIIWCLQLTVHELYWLEIQMWFVTRLCRTRRTGGHSHEAPPLSLQNWDHSTTSPSGSWRCSTATSSWGASSGATTSTDPPLEPSQLQDNLLHGLPVSKGQHFTQIFLLCFLYDINHVWLCRDSIRRREKWH